MADPRQPAAEGAQRRELEWLQWLEHTRQDPAIPFREHWRRFEEIHRHRTDDHGPPIAWRPDREAISLSNLGRLQAELGFDSYDQLHAWSIHHRDQFWQKMIERLGIVFARRPHSIVDGADDPRRVRWLPGAELNSVDSLFTGDPDRPAIVYQGEADAGLEVTTYGELERLVARVASGLVDCGHSPGDQIAIYMPMTVECVAAFLGIIRAGCSVVSIADSFSAAELARRLEIAAAKTVVTLAGYQRGGKRIDLYSKVVAAGAPRAIVLPDAGFESSLRDTDLLWEELLGPAEFESVPASPDATINVLFSSGTTGTPKAIPWNHLTPIKCATDACLHQDVRPGDVFAWPTNVGWMMGPWLIFSTLMNGATMALHGGAPNDSGFIRFVDEAGVTILGVVPTLVRAWRARNLVELDGWPRIRVFSSTGEPSNREDYLWLMSRSGYRAPVIEYMGGTEIGGGYLTGTVVQPASPGTFTTPALGIDIVLLNEQGQPAGLNSPGEAFLIPPAIGLSQRLLNRDHDEAYFDGCPTGPGGEVLRRHGDRLVRLHGGFYRAAGRADDTMNLGGIKVGSLEIEQLLDTHEAVRESAAVGVALDDEGAEVLVVFVRLAGARDAAELRHELGSLLAGRLNPLFKIHDLIPVPELPRTASNKLMRRALRDRYRADRQPVDRSQADR